MEILSRMGLTVLTTLLSLLALFLLTKLMGTKQVSQMTMFDYITGITIGSAAAELATELEEPQAPDGHYCLRPCRCGNLPSDQ